MPSRNANEIPGDDCSPPSVIVGRRHKQEVIAPGDCANAVFLPVELAKTSRRRIDKLETCEFGECVGDSLRY